MESKKTKLIRILLLILSIAVIAAVCLACVYLVWEKAPGGTNSSNTYTLFISGIDEQSYSTEINMVIRLDAERHTIEIVRIPRDTLLNIDFEIRKLGTVYYGAMKLGTPPWDAVSIQMKNLLGFEVSGYAFIPKSVFSDFITDGEINDITTFFSILNSATDTNLTASNIAFLTRQSVNITQDSVRYCTMPSDSLSIRGYGYEVIRAADWIAVINAYLNPLSEPVTEDSLDIVYLDDEGMFTGTKELLGTWFYDNIDEELYEGGDSDEETIPEY